MDIKDLNKNQMVLLTLLMSFVTSIAMSVITVSLLQENPTTVTQTVNRIVERTVETVVPAVTGGKSIVTKETTIVVKEEDLITKSIEKNKDKILAVREKAIGSDGGAVHTQIGWGIVLNKEGLIATDSSFISSEGAYSVLTEDNVSFETKVVAQDENKGVALLSAIKEKGDKRKEEYVFTPIDKADLKASKLGQTLIAFGGKGKKAVAIGIISNITESEAKVGSATSTTFSKKITSIEGTVFPPNKVTGGPIVNSFGEVLGLATATLFVGGEPSYLPITEIVEMSNKGFE